MIMRVPGMLWLLFPLGAALAVSACATPGTRDAAMSSTARLQVAAAADAAGDSGLAISMYAAAAAAEPANIELQMRAADALVRSGNVAEARRLLAERLRGNHDQPDLIRALALVDLLSGQLAEAIAGFDRLLAAFPADARVLVDKAVALDLQGQHKTAQALYQQVLATAPNDAAARNDLAVSMMLEGRIHQALETLAPMQDAEAAPPRLKVNLGLLYAASGDAGRSEQLLGNRLSDGNLAALTKALAAAEEARPKP
jgi:Flp pilus assembly protein TadD